MKRKLLCLGLTSLFLLGCSKKVEEISYEDYQNKISNKEDFIVLISSKSCGHCQSLKETYNKSKYDFVYYDINVDKVIEGVKNNDSLSIETYKHFSILASQSFSNVTSYSYNETYRDVMGGVSYTTMYGEDNHIEGYPNIVYPLSFFYSDGELVNFEVGDYSLHLNKVMDRYGEVIQ